MPRGTPAAGVLLVLLLVACGRPSAQVATGTPFTHPDAGFSVVVPDGWHLQQRRTGVTLVREVQFGGGFPTLNVRRVDAAEADALGMDGGSFTSGARRVQYHYQGWNNARGRGWRLEALLTEGDVSLFADASIWDEQTSLDRAVFEAWFWPVLNSIEDERAP